MPSNHSILKTCPQCGKSFKTWPCLVAIGEGKYCSRECHATGRRKPVEERFWPKVMKTDGCWIWIAGKKPQGYGAFENGRGAHRISWQIHFGPIPPGMCVMHICDNPSCVRPDHLTLGSKADNNADARAKGRNTRGERVGVSKLNAEMVRAIRARYAQGGVTYSEIAADYGVDFSNIAQVVKRKTWKHVP